MRAVFAMQPLRKSIFLAGPTPRPPKAGCDPVPSWRPEALEILARLGFDGDVYVPEAPDWQQHGDYDGQVMWEWEALSQATVAAFWIPREILHVVDGQNELKMPAFTTNVEFGLYAASGKAVLGYPPGAQKISYLEALARRFSMPVYAACDLEVFLKAAVDMAYGIHAGTAKKA